MIRNLLLKALAVIGYIPNLFVWWLVGGPNWRADHREIFWWMWKGGHDR